MELAKNQEHTVTIEGYGEGGMGVARIDGRVVFVHGALRGEKCRVLILKTLKSVAFAKVLEVIEPSSERITPDCPYFPRCGGCTYRHIHYEEELRLKKQRVQDNLSRIGGSDVAVEEILGAQDTLRYRNKAQYPVSKDGRVGFYRARTHEVIECEHCLLVKPEADAAAEALREYMQSCRVAGYDEKTGRGLVRHLYVRSNAAGESLICVLVNGDKLPKEDWLVALLRDACPKCTGIVLGTNTKKGNVILGDRYRTLWGSDRLEDTLCGKTFRLSVPSFYQVNRVQAERLYAKAIEFAGLTGQETVLDLLAPEYRKIGLFPVGRLDKDTEGMLLLTDDGALAHDLLAPKKHVDKVYFVRTDGALDDADCKAFEQGITLGDGLECLPAKLEISKSDAQSEALITIHEGKFHQIKRMLASRGKPVVYLKRLSMGSLTLDEGLSKGEYRLLTAEEIKNLRESGQFAQGKAGADK